MARCYCPDLEMPLTILQAIRNQKVEEKRVLESKLQKQQSLLAQFADNDPERYQHLRMQILL